MKAPDLANVEEAGVKPWSGAIEPLKSAATHAHLPDRRLRTRWSNFTSRAQFLAKTTHWRPAMVKAE